MKKAIEWMQKIQIAVGGFFLCIFLLTVVFQMLSRYIGIAATWTEDVSMYSFIWAVFMGAGAMVYEKRHFAFTSVSDMLKNEKIKSVLAIIISLVSSGTIHGPIFRPLSVDLHGPVFQSVV